MVTIQTTMVANLEEKIRRPGLADAKALISGLAPFSNE